MALEVKRTGTSEPPKLVICIYGLGKSGKTTLAATAPKPIILDGENGCKGLRTMRTKEFPNGIDVPYVDIRTWAEIQECYTRFKDDPAYETVVIDPLGRFMDALIEHTAGSSGMTLQKWGTAIETFKRFVKAWTLSGKHVIFVAHDTFLPDDGAQLRKIQLPGKDLPSVFRNMMDVIGYYSVTPSGERELIVQPTMKLDAGSRFNCFPPVIKEPNITTMIQTIHAAFETKK